MVSKISTCGLMGINGIGVVCECDLSNGMPRFDIVGLPDTAVKESRDRVQAAIKNCDFLFPQKRIIINLAPAELKKEGAIYDLPVLLGILSCSGQIPPPLENCCFFGEVSLEGELRPVRGVLPMVYAMKERGMAKVFLPFENAQEGALVGGIEVYGVKDIKELAACLKGELELTPQSGQALEDPYFDVPDFSDVLGQDSAKRAMVIAAAGFHNALMIGAPGSGKSMIAKRLPGILPQMSEDEALETTMVYSVAGKLKRGNPLIRTAPFRAPHHSISSAGLAGGSQSPKPGEISLAHNGVLFLDELPEFKPDVLEVLRQPLEDGEVTIARAIGSARFPSRFMLICAMNPCKCGYYGQPNNRCTCTDAAVRTYKARISGPLLDRVDLHINVPSVEFESLSERKPSESSHSMREKVNIARKIQLERYRGQGIFHNGALRPDMMHAFCALDQEGKELMKTAFTVFGLSARSYDRILKVARTIADLEGSAQIKSPHIAEAVQYRSLDRDNLFV